MCVCIYQRVYHRLCRKFINIYTYTHCIYCGSVRGKGFIKCILLNCKHFQLRLQVCDRGQLCATTVAKITVRTNQQAPVISPNSYSREILETFPLGDTIFDVNATDGDLTVRRQIFI